LANSGCDLTDATERLNGLTRNVLLTSRHSIHKEHFEYIVGMEGSVTTLREVAQRLRERQVQVQMDRGTQESLIEKLKTLPARIDDEKTVSAWFSCEVCGEVMIDGKRLWTLISRVHDFEEFLRLAESATRGHEGTHRS